MIEVMLRVEHSSPFFTETKTRFMSIHTYIANHFICLTPVDAPLPVRCQAVVSAGKEGRSGNRRERRVSYPGDSVESEVDLENEVRTFRGDENVEETEMFTLTIRFG